MSDLVTSWTKNDTACGMDERDEVWFEMRPMLFSDGFQLETFSRR